ncbi:MAG: type VI secretion system-associated FHA domain protein TagH [Piscinibacter sp.]|uniref:type VI secretion system-associated FHA domain protein TagH n=1 Tax=Piscinibacter sp. TaxID=1903157 RepID=UPI0025887A48|nr:type VI secretion system-associated FHA domain protein TagH [Piscinibacter sp.]MCW5665851.1 type VI secretion system-associated FHA domain protein TagH [Piscinibacter sp.]
MITLTVATYNGAPLAAPLAAQFDELGGNIGRADTNQLVLPDPERTISRVHAQIVFRAGRYAIVDRGSNPISVNGRQLGNGQEAPLSGGEQVQIGGYVLRVELGGAGGAAAADPFADFGGLASPAAPRPAAASLDPLAAFGVPETTPAVRPLTAVPVTAQPLPAAPTAGGIPDDWDPFAPEPASAKPADFARSLGQGPGFGLDVASPKAAPLIPDLPGQAPAAADSLDNLFGLGGGAPASVDPLAGGVFGQAAAQPNMAAHADPMQSLNSLTRGTATAKSDAGSELHAPFLAPPSPLRPAAAPAIPAIPEVPPAAPRGAPSIKGAVLSWEDPSGDSHTVIRPRPRAPAAAPLVPPLPAAPAGPAAALPDDALFDLGLGSAPAAPVAPVDPPTMITVRPKAAPVPAAAAPAAPAAPAARGAAAGDNAALIAALREGLGMPQLPLDSLTPEFMRLLGQLVHESARGTVDLLVARAALKREIRAEVTMIVAKENNPLKFSPTVEVALGHLLSPPQRGFLPPERAMREAYDDLRAHQFAFVAGMRAALEGVLKRFDPAVLESKLTQKSVLASVLPAARKARMWDVFTELYGQISAEASDDFHELFGKEFLRAYEAHIDQLSKGR